MARVAPRPRLLFLCQTLPYPPDGGVWMRTYHVLRRLAEVYEVTALCFERSKRSGAAHDVDASRQELSRFGDAEAFPLPQQQSVTRFAWDHLRSLLLGRVYTTYLYESPRFRERLQAWLRSTSFDLIHVDSLDLARYLPDCRGVPVVPVVPVVVVHHDVESELLERRGSLEATWWKRAYLAHQSRLMRSVERFWCPRIALNVVCSQKDATLLDRIAPGSRVAVVPNGVEIDSVAADPASGTGVAFVGGTQPFPNLDALSFFCSEVLPHVRAGRPDVRVTWIGRATAAEQSLYRERYGVDLTGYVDDAQPLMRAARCHVVPLRAGGGTRLKILSAWALAKPVVSTPIGCEGLEARDGDNLLIGEQPAALAAAILDVLRDDDLARRLGSAGRATVERLYSWDVVARGMLDAYKRLTIPVSDSSHAYARADCGPSIARA